MSKTAVEVDDIRKGLSRMSVEDDDEGWLGGSTSNKKRGRGRGAPNTNNNSGSGPNNNNTANNPTRGRGQSPNNKDTVRKDKVKILAVAWDKDVILTLQKHPELEMDSDLKKVITSVPAIDVPARDDGVKVSKLSVSKAFRANSLPQFLSRFKQLKPNEIVAEEVKHNGHVIGSIYFCMTSSAKDKISSYNLFKTHPIRTFKPTFLHENDFVRFAGPVIYTQHENNEYVLCSSNRGADPQDKLDLFGGTCNFTIDQIPAHSAAREFLEEISYVSEDAVQVREQLVTLFDTCQKKYLYGALAYKVSLDRLPEKVICHVPKVGQEKELKESTEKEKLFWMQPKDIVASDQFRFGPKSSIKQFYGLN